MPRKTKTLDTDVHARLNELARRLRQPDNADSVWRDLLTAAQRKRIESRVTWQRSIITMWAKVKRVSEARAIIDMAYELGWLGEAERKRLRKAVGEHGLRSTNRAKPSYRDGLVHYDGEIVRSVKQFKNRSKVQVLLDRFQEKKWPRKVVSPWPTVEDAYQAVHMLNKGLDAIIFEVIDSGKHIRWTERG